MVTLGQCVLSGVAHRVLKLVLRLLEENGHREEQPDYADGGLRILHRVRVAMALASMALAVPALLAMSIAVRLAVRLAVLLAVLLAVRLAVCLAMCLTVATLLLVAVCGSLRLSRGRGARRSTKVARNLREGAANGGLGDAGILVKIAALLQV